MPSKGLDVYSYIGLGLEGHEVHFTTPGGSVIRGRDRNFTSDRLEIEHKDLGGTFKYTGRFEWKVVHDGRVVAAKYNDISSLTGNLEGGDMLRTVDQKSLVVGDAVISFGFYDAGHGEAGLTNRDQCYVYIAHIPTHSTWMTQIVPPGSAAEEKAFHRFALAAPHDDGMNSMDTCQAVLHGKDETVVAELVEHIPAIHWLAEHVSHKAIAHFLPNLVYGLAITQKDDIPTLLSLGARYFEFRPANLLPIFHDAVSEHVPNEPYFQHACIPGLAFSVFLEQIVSFLDANPGELTVVHIRWDNIVAKCKKPTPEELDAAFDKAVARASANRLSWGDAACFRSPIRELRQTGKRLIRIIEAEKYDSWTAKAYATLTADPILAQFESMNTQGQEETDITVLQCQATSQSIKEVLVYSVLTCNADTSCLTSTKADLDRHTLPWIRDNALKRLQAEKLLVVMNDFLEAATTDTVIELNRQRFAQP